MIEVEQIVPYERSHADLTLYRVDFKNMLTQESLGALRSYVDGKYKGSPHHISTAPNCMALYHSDELAVLVLVQKINEELGEKNV